MGFTLTPTERDVLAARNKENGERIFPYLGGQEVNASPTQEHDRYIISFGQMTLEEAERWPDLLAILREKVKPERDRNNRGNYRELWWQFAEFRPGLFRAIGSLHRCIVTSRHTKHLCFSFQPTDRIFSEAMNVFALPAFSSMAVLQCRIHESWARLMSSLFGSSSIGAVLRYAASDCFETFPFPQPDPRTVIPAVEAIGERLYLERAQYMVDLNQGLTQTYNQLKDPRCAEPRILALRTLHEDMDRAVLDAYGWTDLTVPPFCPKTPDEQHALEEFQDAVIDRLFVLNAERAAEEKRLAPTKPTKGKSGKARARKAKGQAAGNPDQRRLFGKDE